jgi:hypothetical protein
MSDFKWQVREGGKVIAQFVANVDAVMFYDMLDGLGGTDKVHRTVEPINEQQAEKD